MDLPHPDYSEHKEPAPARPALVGTGRPSQVPLNSTAAPSDPPARHDSFSTMAASPLDYRPPAGPPPTDTPYEAVDIEEKPLVGSVTPPGGAPSLKGTTLHPSMLDPAHRGGYTRREIYERLVLALVLEAVWLIFVGICHFRTVVAPRSMSSPIVKGIFTSATIIWQIIALAPLTAVATSTFASEWRRRYAKTGEMVPGITDRVSVLSAGWVERIMHIWRGDSSTPFLVAVVAAIFCTAISAIAPGSVSLEPVSVGAPARITIGRMLSDTTGGSATTYPTVDPVSWAKIVAKYQAAAGVYWEMVEHRLLDYYVPGNAIIGLPDQAHLNQNFTYTTDAVLMDFSCDYYYPNVTTVDSGFPDTPPISTFHFGPWPLVGNIQQLSTDMPIEAPGPWPLTGLSFENITAASPAAQALSLNSLYTAQAWVLAAARSPDPRFYLDLTPVPADRVALDMNVTRVDQWVPTRQLNETVDVTILACFPNVTYTTVDVKAVQRVLTIDKVYGGPRTVGNIPDMGEINMMIANSLTKIAAPWIPYKQLGFGAAAGAMLFTDQTEGFLNTTTGVMMPPDPLVQSKAQTAQNITENIGRYVASAARAFMSGSLASMVVDGSQFEDRLAFRTSLWQWIVSLCLVVLACLLTLVQAHMQRDDPLTLSSMSRLLFGDNGQGPRAKLA